MKKYIQMETEVFHAQKLITQDEFIIIRNEIEKYNNDNNTLKFLSFIKENHLFNENMKIFLIKFYNIQQYENELKNKGIDGILFEIEKSKIQGDTDKLLKFRKELYDKIPIKNYGFKVLSFIKCGNRYNFPKDVSNKAQNYFEFSNKDFISLELKINSELMDSEEFKNVLLKLAPIIFKVQNLVPILNTKEKDPKMFFKSHIHILKSSKLTLFNINNKYDENYMKIFCIHEIFPETCDNIIFVENNRNLYEEIKNTELKTLKDYYNQYNNISIEKYESFINIILNSNLKTEKILYTSRRVINQEYITDTFQLKTEIKDKEYTITI